METLSRKILVDTPAAANLGASFSCDIDMSAYCGVSISIKLTNTNAVGKFEVFTGYDSTHLSDTPREFSDGTTNVPVATGVSFNEELDLGVVRGGWLRLTYTRASGDGLVEIFATLRGV